MVMQVLLPVLSSMCRVRMLVESMSQEMHRLVVVPACEELSSLPMTIVLQCFRASKQTLSLLCSSSAMGASQCSQQEVCCIT